MEHRTKKSADVGGMITNPISVLSIEELSAGKLLALFSRNASRDLLDTYHLLQTAQLDRKKLKIAFLLYGIIGGKDLRKLSIDTIKFDKDDLENKLIPVLRKKYVEEHFTARESMEKIEIFCKSYLQDIVEFCSQNKDLVAKFYQKGDLAIEEITDDTSLINKMATHP